MEALVHAKALDTALSLYAAQPQLADHGPTAAALLRGALDERPLDAVVDLRQGLATAEPNHPLLAEADLGVHRLEAYARLRDERQLDAEAIARLSGTEFKHLVSRAVRDAWLRGTARGQVR